MSAPTTLTRTLFTHPRVHIYPIPPLKSITTGHKAADWGVDKETSKIFTAKLRIVETTLIKSTPSTSTSNSDDENEERIVTTDIRLEVPETGELFANCPYTGDAVCVDPVLDSSRFFAIRVVDGPRKAFLGMGFEDRSAAFDFGVCLQEVRRHNGLDAVAASKGGPRAGGKASAAGASGSGGSAGFGALGGENPSQKKDYSLKEGETIKITIGNKGRRKTATSSTSTSTSSTTQPTGALPLPFLPPPPSADEEKKRRRESYKQQDTTQQSLSDWASAQDWGAFESSNAPEIVSGDSKGLGFDDDPFGDFV